MSTHSSQSIDLPRTLASSIFWDAIKVEHECREHFSVMSLPLSYRIKSLCRRFLVPDWFCNGLSIFFSCSMKLPLKRTWLAIICSSRKESRVPWLIGRGFCPGWGPCILLHTIDYLFLRWRLSIRDIQLGAGRP